MKSDNFHVGIISHNRSANVENMQKIIPGEIGWYVGTKEYQAYKDAGARHVIESGKLCESRNQILRDAWSQNKIAVMLDDDLKEIVTLNPHLEKIPITFEKLLDEMYRVMEGTDLKLCGVASTTNAFFYHNPFSFRHFIGGWLMMIKKCDLFFDENLKTKEDYDYTIQHVKKYKGALRINYLMPRFLHFNNKGGVVDTRTPEVEQESIRYLKKKWGTIIRDNTKRPNEILLKL